MYEVYDIHNGEVMRVFNTSDEAWSYIQHETGDPGRYDIFWDSGFESEYDEDEIAGSE